MRVLPEKGKCESCGDMAELYIYNNARTCSECLGMDRRGVKRAEILKRNTGKKYDKSELRRSRKSRR
jgi:L-fucose isomerase-like protein